MAGTAVLTPPVRMPGTPIVVPAGNLSANPWNPNKMDDAMLAKERESIVQYGFVVPVVVREIGPLEYQIIDGEHRYRIGLELGMSEFPCWNLGEVDEATARQLTIVLNETRGTADEDKLGNLIRDLLGRRDEEGLRAAMPFSKERFDALVKRGQTADGVVDWGALEARKQQQAAQQTQGAQERWTERVFRLPPAAAEVLDQAIAKAKEEAETENNWQALELIAADYLSGS